MATLDQDDFNRIAKVVDRNVLDAPCGSYGSFSQMMTLTADNVRLLVERTNPVRRGAPEGNVEIPQEIADSKTLGLQNKAKLTELEAKVDRILTILEAQRG